jgi:hypothetical protein
LVAGDENKANPVPTRIRPNIIMLKDVLSFKEMNNRSPRVVMAIPMEVIIRVSILSDILPAKGDKIATERGCRINIIPAALGVNTLRY